MKDPNNFMCESAAPQQTLMPPENYLEVGLTDDGREVVINHPQMMRNSNGVGYIVFSASQARQLARLLLRKADECRR